jgi:hypothetical protein
MVKIFLAVLAFAVIAQTCGLGEYGRHPNALLLPGPGRARKAVRRQVPAKLVRTGARP